jgi:hypothetical protein
MEYHEFLAYLFDHPHTRALAQTLAAASHVRQAVAPPARAAAGTGV